MQSYQAEVQPKKREGRPK